MTIARFRATNHPQQTRKNGATDHVDDRETRPEVFGPLNDRFAFTLDVAAAAHNAKTPRYYTRQDNGLTMPWGHALWQGPTCLMCDGTGRDRTDVTGEGALTVPVIGYAELDYPCRACNGHGRDADDINIGPERVWCNPPYSDCGAWVQRGWAEWKSDAPPELIVMLLPANRVEQGWWQDHVEPHRDRPGSPLHVEFLRGRMRFNRPGATIGPKGDRPPFGCCLLIWGDPT